MVGRSNAGRELRENDSIMASTHDPEPDPARDKTRGLADHLVCCLGRDGAIHVCKLNGWPAVLAAIVEGTDSSSNTDTT